MTLRHYIDGAIKARGVMHRDTDYIVKDGEVIIVDEFTGRLMYGRRFNDGLHQAIEAKEGVTVAAESKTLASITFQNYFRMYKKLGGMTGTASTEADEFSEIYGLQIVSIPTNKPRARKDLPDSVYKTINGKYNAVIEQVAECHAKGQPVLVGTVSVEKSETRMTIRKAIDLLVAWGLVVRRHGSGTYLVRKDVLHQTASLTGLVEVLKRQGKTVTSQVLIFEIMPAPPAIASQLRIQINEQIYFSRRVRFVEGKPLMLEDSRLAGGRSSTWSRIRPAHTRGCQKPT